MSDGPKIVRMVEKSSDAAHISPVETLNQVIAEHDVGGPFEGRRKLLVLSIDTNNAQFNLAFRNAGMSCSEIIAALRIMEHQALVMMDYAAEPPEQSR